MAVLISLLAETDRLPIEIMQGYLGRGVGVALVCLEAVRRLSSYAILCSLPPGGALHQTSGQSKDRSGSHQGTPVLTVELTEP